MTIEHKLNESNEKRDYGKNILCLGIGVAGMYVFGGNIVYKTLEIANEINSSGQSVAEFYQANKMMFLKADANVVLFGLNVINTYIGMFHKFYEHKLGDKNK
ncbi:MAG: hypothetical protein ACP5N2_02280 [Candidatus Nanoarchaeia archaeon]